MILLLLALFQGPADAILGRWEGTSTCVKAEWNASCHDEVTRYDFVRPPGRGDTITVSAFKRVNGDWEAMGDFDLRYDAAGHRWVGEFANSRTHVELSYWIEGAQLHGQMVQLPGRRKGRDIAARRVAAPG